MTDITEKLRGKKTYAVALVVVTYAICGMLLNKLPQSDGIELILQAAAVAGLRLGIAGK